MTAIVDLAPELLELVLSYLPPHHLVSFARTCHYASQFIRPSNQMLWKATFLQIFDHPKYAWSALVPTARLANRAVEAEWDWHHELQRRLEARNAVCEQRQTANAASVEDVVGALLAIEETASRTTLNEENDQVSFNLNFISELQNTHRAFDIFVHDYHKDVSSASLPSELLVDIDRPFTRSMHNRTMAVPVWASRLHIIHGPTAREEESVRSKAAARAVVYDWNVTGPLAEFGPLKKDHSGAVDWQVVEAISSLMNRIFATALKAYRLSPSGFPINIPNALPPDPAVPEDWAGVNGKYLGTYAFLDYRALVHYNFAHNQEYPLDLGTYEEACGDLMRLEIKMDNSDELKQDARLQTELPRCEDLPTLFFNGSSHNPATNRPSIGVRGFASLVPGGRSVRWRFIIRYAGSDQWQLEGVQPSGVRSGPIYGLWSHVDHEDHGPMGPFYYAPAELCCGRYG